MNSNIDVAKIMADITCDVQERYSELAIKEREKNMYEHCENREIVRIADALSNVNVQCAALNAHVSEGIKWRNGLIVNEIETIKARAGIAWKTPTYEWKNPILRLPLKLYAKLVSKLARPITAQQNDINDNVSRTLELLQQSTLSMANWSQAVEKQINTLAGTVNTLANSVNNITNTVNNHRDVLQCHENNSKYQSDRLEYLNKILRDMNQVNFTDKMYLDFEEKYRGSMEEIKKKQLFYVDNYVLPNVSADSLGMVIDIGCGRGEWLSLLAERGYRGVGVDLNTESLKCCEDKNIKTVCMDGIDYLKTLPAESVKLLTSFQLVEHITTNQLLELMKQIARVMRKDGLVIIETPNPSNVNVGASAFYLDLTHKRQIPSELLTFIAEENELTVMDIAHWQQEEIDRWWDSVWQNDETGITKSNIYRAMEDALKKSIWCAADYALIAKK